MAKVMERCVSTCEAVMSANDLYAMNSLIAMAFPSKLPAASLNLSTYIALYTYGYRNVYELGPQIDPKESKLPLEPTAGKR